MKRLLLLGLAACAPKAPVTAAALATDLDFGTTPRIQPTNVAAYAGGPVLLRDSVIGPLLERRRVDGALLGAAGDLALSIAEGEGGAARWELREALWRGGWPHPVHDARAWTTSAGQAPPPEVFAWLDGVGEGEVLGLARARGPQWDAWVGVRARPTVALGAPPRIAATGSPVTLPAVPGGTWRAADGAGRLQGGVLDEGATILLTTAGEWLVHLAAGDRELARFPIYVGMPAPDAPVLRLPEPADPVTDDVDARALAARLLDHVRDIYGRPAWTPSPVLDAAVDRYLADPQARSADVLAALGFPAASSVAWACDDTTVENCIDGWLWDVRRREALLGTAMDSYGLRAIVDASGVHLTLLLVDAEP